MNTKSLKPKISIIVAVYNGDSTIQKCIDSIRLQNYQNKELIIIDGYSSDQTVDIIKKNEAYINYWESKKDNGIADAWNKALEHSTGDWILFLGSDDHLIDNTVLSDMSGILEKDLVSDIIYGKITFDGGKFNKAEVGHNTNLSKLKKRMTIPHVAAFHRKNFFHEVGKFDGNFKIAMDYEILLRKKNFSANYVNRSITIMGGDGVSSRLIKKTLLEGRTAQLKNKVDWRIKIEAWHLFYHLRNYFS